MTPSAGKPRWIVTRTAPTVLTVSMPYSGKDWEQWFLLRSDAHHDNLHCDHHLERRHLDMALERGAGILDFGDLFCAMQGKWDKRADVEQLRPELVSAKYLDRLVDYNADFYRRYAANWILLARGNHETSIERHHQTDLTERLAEHLRLAGGQHVHAATYSGWVRFQFNRGDRVSKKRILRYTHGYGGGGPVTRDVIQTARQAVYLGGADLVVSGHTHDAWELPIMRETLDHTGQPQLEEMAFVKIPGYKDEFSSGQGWAVEKGMGPKPKGAYWLRFYSNFREGGVHKERIRFELIRAKA